MLMNVVFCESKFVRETREGLKLYFYGCDQDCGEKKRPLLMKTNGDAMNVNGIICMR